MNKSSLEDNARMARHISRVLERITYIRNREVIYVKGCDGFWLYERKSKVRGARINGVNYDMTVLFLAQNRNWEIHEFFINSKAYIEEPEWEDEVKELIAGIDIPDYEFDIVEHELPMPPKEYEPIKNV